LAGRVNYSGAVTTGCTPILPPPDLSHCTDSKTLGHEIHSSRNICRHEGKHEFCNAEIMAHSGLYEILLTSQPLPKAVFLGSGSG
jgi:hypothetical protein